MSREEQKYRSEAVRNSIIEATAKLIKEKGFEGVSIRNIGKSMGYSTGVIYYHFKNKQEIINTIHEEANSNVINIVNNARPGNKRAIENIMKVFSEITKIAVNDKDFFDLIIIDKYSVRRESVNPWLLLIEEELERGMEKGEIKKLDPKQTAFCLWSAFLGFHYMIGKMEDMDMKKAEELFNSMSEMIASGIEINTGKGEIR